ncbi:hypothetical protein N7488_008020 [Penicillium malachiteum]|nr:hypothetical protein N7488_008020 [Penicillium malachiteum]
MSPNTQLRKKESCESFWFCEDLHEKEPHRVFTHSTIENMAKLVDKMPSGEHGNWHPPDDGNYPKVFFNYHREFPANHVAGDLPRISHIPPCLPEVGYA